jgi:hypothetical protein
MSRPSRTASRFSSSATQAYPQRGQPIRAGWWTTVRHIGNAVLREDARGARLAKERKDSPRRIDAAVAAVMAHDRAAALAGVTRDGYLYLTVLEYDGLVR